MTTAVLVLARTLHIGSAMMIVALPFFRLVILRPVFVDDEVENYASFCRGMIKWLWIFLVMEAVSGVVWFWFVSAQMSDQSPWGLLDAADLNTVLWQTQFGQLWVGRVILGIGFGVTLCFEWRRETLKVARPSLVNWLMLASSGLLLMSLAWAGHAAAGIHHHVLHLVADVVHLLVGAIWPMGLIPMAWVLWHIKRSRILPTNSDIRMLQRFSQISLRAVLILVATGFINGWLMVGTWDALVTTIYGQLLLAKVLVVAIMIGLGAVNRSFLMPRMQTEPIRFRALQRTVLAESCLALAVLLIVGLMGMTSPPS